MRFEFFIASRYLRAKRQESREAYTFIDNQVNTYREQLQTAEDKLKNFKGGSNVTSGACR